VETPPTIHDEPVLLRGKPFDSVQEMVRAVSEDKEQAEKTARAIDRRQIVDFLMAIRSAKEVSQGEIARKMGHSQSKISKLENGDDDSLRVGALRAYISALGLEMMILVGPKQKPTIADQIKLHAGAISRLLTSLVGLVGKDAPMGVAALRLIEAARGSLDIAINAATDAIKTGIQDDPAANAEPCPLIQFEDEPRDSCQPDWVLGSNRNALVQAS
jgi:transcriptional regulator with XRE-family HTH domain